MTQECNYEKIRKDLLNLKVLSHFLYAGSLKGQVALSDAPELDADCRVPQCCTVRYIYILNLSREFIDITCDGGLYPDCELATMVLVH